jgi:hypothetical protein
MAQMDAALATLDSKPMDDAEQARLRAIGDHIHRQRSFF